MFRASSEMAVAISVASPEENPSSFATTRQKGRVVANELGFSSGDATLIATAISELARNIVSYARKGLITIKKVNGHNREGIAVIAADEGPGIPDIRQAL